MYGVISNPRGDKSESVLKGTRQFSETTVNEQPCAGTCILKTPSSTSTCASDSGTRVYMDIDVFHQFGQSHEIQEPSRVSKFLDRVRQWFRRGSRSKLDEFSDRAWVLNACELTYYSDNLR